MKTKNNNLVSLQERKAAQIENDEYIKKESTKRKVKSYALLIVGTIIYSFGIIWFLQLGGFFSSGVAGLSQILVRLPSLWGGPNLQKYLGLCIGVINTPLILLGWRGVSKRYAILTVLSVALQTIMTSLLSNFTNSPLITLLTGEGEGMGLVEAIRTGNLNIFTTTPIMATDKFAEIQASFDPGHKILLALCGGGITGFGMSLCLKSGGSSGGMDIVACFLQQKKRIDFTKYSSICDTTIILVSSIFSVENVLYTLIRLVTTLKVIDSVYTSYKIMRLEIITAKGDEIRNALIKTFHHGITVFEAVGGYTLSERKVLEIYASSYEVHEYIRIIHNIDPFAFVSATKSKIINGNYIQKTII